MRTEHGYSYLRERGFRLTPQRLAILEILKEYGGHLTPAQVYQRAALVMPGLTEPTVYRTLSFLAAQGLALAAHLETGQMLYEYAGHNHHHLICRDCGHMLEVDHELLEGLYTQLQANTGFQIDSMHITFFGHCPGCRGNHPVNRPPSRYLRRDNDSFSLPMQYSNRRLCTSPTDCSA